MNKSFGTIKILKSICFDVSRSEFIAIHGDAGSGKSMFIKIIAGYNRPSSGQISWCNAPININGQYSPHLFQSKGIYCIHSKLDLISSRSIKHQFYKDKEIKKLNFGFASIKNHTLMAKSVSKELASTKILTQLNPFQKIDSLSYFEQLVICISKAKFRGAKLIILDDILSQLSDKHIPKLCSYISNLKKQGLSFLINVDEIDRVSDYLDRAVLFHDGLKLTELSYNELQHCIQNPVTI